jgi:valyl-tRNA synthetase
MSKSLGNGIDPLEIIDKYGADALRLTLITGNAPGNDMRFYYERVESSRNFANKIWNASRFIMMNIEKAADISGVTEKDLTLADKWILSKVNALTKDVTENLANMTEPSFCRYFKKITNKTFTQFVNEYRIIHSMKLLAEKPLSINEICYESGFNNFSYFNKTFKEYTQKSPSQYRKEFKNIIE